MPILIFGLLFLLIAAFIAFAGVRSIFRRRLPVSGRLLASVGGVMMLAGSLGFWGHAFATVGLLNWLPSSFEWPVGEADQVLTQPDGTHLVPVVPGRRVQVYTADWRFVRGWPVSSGDTTFKLGYAGDDRVEVFTARGHMRYLYTLNGELLNQQHFPQATFAEVGGESRPQWVPTSPWLWIFSSPGAAAIVGAAGFGLLILGAKRAGFTAGKKKDNSATSSTSQPVANSV
jgi:hypothetical protein